MNAGQFIPHLFEKSLIAMKVAIPNGRSLFNVRYKTLYVQNNGGFLGRHKNGRCNISMYLYIFIELIETIAIFVVLAIVFKTQLNRISNISNNSHIFFTFTLYTCTYFQLHSPLAKFIILFSFLLIERTKYSLNIFQFKIFTHIFLYFYTKFDKNLSLFLIKL